ncbi:hypothetical protein LCGC14_0375510 [marine sediment metagenome]|uniref:Uncharacterized protein n=1 Tax=marine sediment metagenome TaxID=412755 RepID=A0A0F9T9X3_9ZZZZ
MSTLKLTTIVDGTNPIEGDLQLDAGQIVLLENSEKVPSPEAVVQELRQKLHFFKGEWHLDKREGIPYFEEVFKKNPNKNIMRAIFRDVILGINGVETVETLDLVIGSDRRAQVNFEGTMTDGGRLSSKDFPPLIVELP